jgi:non-specific serine/threonine protein kinase
MRLIERAATDWLHRHDTRVWDALWSMAVGFQTLGDHNTAAALKSAIGSRTLGTISPNEQNALEPLRPTGPVRGPVAAVALASDRLAILDNGTVRSIDGVRSLTPRQQQVASLLARGMRNKEIAAALGISPMTAETHVRNILERTGAPTRAAAAAMVAEGRLG